jgi:hypothetical protein
MREGASFAQSTGSRFCTAMKVARIIAVEYPPVISSTPSTAIASCELLTPASSTSSGGGGGLPRCVPRGEDGRELEREADRQYDGNE